MVFYNHELPGSARTLPRYIDLGYYAAQDGIPFTHSSNLVYALQTALRRTVWLEKHAQISEVGRLLRERLAETGFEVLAPQPEASPAVFTIVLPRTVKSKVIGWRMRKGGCLLSYQSEYLL